MHEALFIHVTGVVQGVGFRPFVYQIAQKHLIKGWVLNAADGVHIHGEAPSANLDAFISDINLKAPEASVVKEIAMTPAVFEGFTDFSIRFSDDSKTQQKTLVSPDLACCSDCVAELFNPENRRYRYPFINCTQCGPRFTIIESLPYDRPATSMRNFSLCDTCAQEYADPLDRRFHAQPNACFSCGPALFLAERQALDEHIGETYIPQDQRSFLPAVWADGQSASDALIARVVDVLRKGGIVAIKGLGGYHLACDANNAEALSRLRTRKARPHKPFALMAPDLNTIQHYVHLSSAEEGILSSKSNPIVLLRKKKDLARGVADGLSELGFMLPATPLQHLILKDFGSVLVMTSANVSGSPIIADDEDAKIMLTGIADVILGNNRAIAAAFDDSVVRVLDLGFGMDGLQVVRRARGYAPYPLKLDTNTTRRVLALGPEQKSTFALTRPTQDATEVFVSQHLGDLENVQTYDTYEFIQDHYQGLFDLDYDQLACDMHPRYFTSQLAEEKLKSNPGLKLVKIQHHHAHIAAVMGENKLHEATLGFAFDGTGYGADGALWGGEALLCNRSDYERFANIAYFPLVGGSAAISHPLQGAYGVLSAYDLLDHPAAKRIMAELGKETQLFDTMIERGINCPMSSSMGRLFDAASALLGLAPKECYEGHAACLLEGVLGGTSPKTDEECYLATQDAQPYRFEFLKNTATPTSTAHDTSVIVIDPAPTFAALLDDIERGVRVDFCAQRFHEAVVEMMLTLARLVRDQYDINTVATAGGVFMNRYISERSCAVLVQDGFKVAMPQELPSNDGAISYGQAVVALERSLHA